MQDFKKENMLREFLDNRVRAHGWTSTHSLGLHTVCVCQAMRCELGEASWCFFAACVVRMYKTKAQHHATKQGIDLNEVKGGPQHSKGTGQAARPQDLIVSESLVGTECMTTSLE